MSETNEQEAEQYPIPHTMKLSFPFEWGKESKETRDSITIHRRIKAKDFKGMRPSDLRFDDMLKICVKITGEPGALIEELDGKDLMDLMAIVNDFLGVGQEDGKD